MPTHPQPISQIGTRVEKASVRQHHRAPPSEIGHWVRTAGILSPLVIGELVKDPQKQWRFIRITSVAVALISEGMHVHRLRREREEREARQRQGVTQLS